MKDLMRVSLMAATLTFAGAFAFAQGDAPAKTDAKPAVTATQPTASASASASAAAPGSEQMGLPGQPGGPAGMPGGQMRPRMDPAQFQERMLDRFKEQLKCTDEEWTAIKPLLQKVQELQRSSMMGGGRGGMRNRPGGQPGVEQPGGPQPGAPGAPGAPAAEDASNDAQSQLRKLIANDGASADDIKEKVKAVRAEREKSAATLKTAREELRKVLTARQEAVLIMMGVLD